VVLKPTVTQPKSEAPSIYDYWAKREITDNDRDQTKGAIGVGRILPEFDGILYILRDDSKLSAGYGRSSSKEVTIRLVSYGLICLNRHPKFGQIIEDICDLHRNINTKCCRTENLRRWFGHQVQLDNHPSCKYTFYTGEAAKGYIDEYAHRLGLTKYALTVLLFCLGLEHYDFGKVDQESAFLNERVADNLRLFEDILLDRLVIMKAFSGEFFINTVRR